MLYSCPIANLNLAKRAWLVMNMSVERHTSRKGNKNYGVLERDMQVHLVLYWRSNVMFTLMKIFVKVD